MRHCRRRSDKWRQQVPGRAVLERLRELLDAATNESLDVTANVLRAQASVLDVTSQMAGAIARTNLKFTALGSPVGDAGGAALVQHRRQQHRRRPRLHPNQRRLRS